MSFDSLMYPVFLAITVCLHWLLPHRLRWAFLLLASYAFYASWHLSLSLLIFGVTAVSFLGGLLLDRTEKPLLRSLTLVLSLVLLLGTLGYFKYFNLLGRTLASLTGQTFQPFDILLPVGISFYTFQAISYVADVYRKKLRAEKHFGYYALYIAFFPQLVAGPIERAGSLIPQLRSPRSFSLEDLKAGLCMILTGFFRKLVIADLIAPFVDAVYRSDLPDGSAVCIATVLFAVQIYCDFSGYSEIALGSARCLGIRIMPNFQRPYAAADIRSFWRRWHISLTVWFTDYVYIPLGGSRKGLFRQMLATTLVFALCGLWHGADWSFVLWGLMHALYMLVYLLARKWIPGKLPVRMGRCLTFSAVCLAWVFFRSATTEQAFLFLRQLFSPWHAAEGINLLLSASLRNTPGPALLALFVLLLLVLRRLPSPADEDGFRKLPDPAWSGLALAVLLAVLIRWDAGTANAFIYFQF